MKTLSSSALLAAGIACIGTAAADNHESEASDMVIRPVAAAACNFNDGMGPDDLDDAVAEWNEWMDERGANGYFAMTVTPVYYGSETFDFGWLGSWMSGDDMGAGLDDWHQHGGEMAATFAAVATCSTNSNFATGQIKPMASEDDDDEFVISFSNCTIRDGVDFDGLVAGFKAVAAKEAEQGFVNGTWMMFPVFGGGDEDFDFKLVDASPNFTQFGRIYEWYSNGGGWQYSMEHAGSVASCDVARLYNAKVRRNIEAEE